MSVDENTNELSWLKGAGKKSELSPLRPQENDDAPSWLHEDSGAETKESKGGKYATDHKTTKGGVKWKQHITTKALPQEDSGDEGESCCCCFSSDPMLFSFQCFHITAGLSGLGAFIANVYVFSRPHITLKEAIIRSYALIFCVLMVLTELDWRYVVNKVRFMDYWLLRGIFYTFIGFITCELSYFRRFFLSLRFFYVVPLSVTSTTVGLADAQAAPIDTPEDIVGFIVFIIGLCYMIMVMICIRMFIILSDSHRELLFLLSNLFSTGRVLHEVNEAAPHD